MGTGLLATLSALVLGLLIASAKSSFDAQRTGLQQLSTNLILLDRSLKFYGPETKEAREQLPRALPLVASGGFWVPREVLSRFVDSILSTTQGRRLRGDSPAELSRREQEVLAGLLENLANKEVADRLHISERTVKFHVSNLLAKFGVRRRADLILLCYQRRGAGV